MEIDVVTIAALVLFLVERFAGARSVDKLLGKVNELLDLAQKERQKLLDEFARERSELLVRIQHPQVILPPRAPDAPAAVEPEEDELDLVGTVTQAIPAEDPGPGPDKQ